MTLKSLNSFERGRSSRTPYGCGVGEACGSGARRKVGGAGLFGSVFGVPSEFVVVVVVVGSSGVGCLRFSVGRPGVPSSLEAIAPVLARAFDSLSRRFFTR
jgi:hypothetical protein